MHRVLKFYVVGVAGMGIQLAVLALLAGWLRLHYLAATLAAVETAILHNFFWHWRWTFRERLGGRDAWSGRLLRFQFGTGAVSLLGNLLILRLLVEGLRAPLPAANLAAIGCCSLFNYLLSDLWVFSSAGDFTQSRIRAKRHSELANKDAKIQKREPLL